MWQPEGLTVIVGPSDARDGSTQHPLIEYPLVSQAYEDGEAVVQPGENSATFSFTVVEKDSDGADGDDGGGIVVGHWHSTWLMLLAVEIALGLCLARPQMKGRSTFACQVIWCPTHAGCDRSGDVEVPDRQCQ